MKIQTKIKCPTCGKPDTWTESNIHKPFCCDRCKMIDLGEWASDTRVIPGKKINPDAMNHDDDLDY